MSVSCVAPATLLKKTQVFSCEFCEISKNTSGGCFCYLFVWFSRQGRLESSLTYSYCHFYILSFKNWDGIHRCFVVETRNKKQPSPSHTCILKKSCSANWKLEHNWSGITLLDKVAGPACNFISIKGLHCKCFPYILITFSKQLLYTEILAAAEKPENFGQLTQISL